MRRSLSAWLGVSLLSFGCDSGPPPEQELVQASSEVSFGDIANLGPHRLEASISRAVVVNGERSDQGQEQIQLVWSDWDNFQIARRQRGVIISQVHVQDGSARTRRADAQWASVADVEPHRVELRMAWDVWAHGLSVFQDHVAFEHLGDAPLDGRVASQYGISLQPGADQVHGRAVPESLSGTVWIDEATAVRLMAEVEGRWHQLGRTSIVNEVEVILVRTDFGLVMGKGAWSP